MRSVIAVLPLLLGATTASAQDVAIQRMNNAGGIPIQSGGGHAFSPPAGYVQPTIVNNYLIAAGDSRTANSMIFPAWSSGTFTTATNYSNGYAGWLFPLSGNRYLAEIGWNYAVGAQTTAGVAGRLWNTTQYCNDSGSIGAACFTDASSTISSAISANPSSSLTIPLGTVSGTPAAGDFITSSVGVNFGCAITSYNSSTPSVTVPANCITGPISSGAAVAFAHPAHASSFTSYAPFQSSGTAGATITDVDTNKVNGGAYYGGSYSFATDPAQVLFLMAGTNNANRSITNSVADLQSIFNAYGPSGFNKIVVMSDEVPRGLAEGYSQANASTNGSPEAWTIPSSSPYTITVANASSYYDTQQVLYAPCGATTTGTPAYTYYCGTTASGVTFSPGSSDGTALTQVTGTPSAGQYSVSNGIYTFNSSDAGKHIVILYRWVNDATVAAPNYLTTIHNWLDSTSCGSWTDPLSSTTYSGTSGAQCAGLYPWVHVASTWSALLDTSTGSNAYNLPYTSVDGLHPTPYGGALLAQAMLSAGNSVVTSMPPTPYAVATANNTWFYGTTYVSSSAQTSTCPTATKGYYIANVTVGTTALTSLSSTAAAAMFPVGAKVYFQNSTQASNNGLSITCVDTTNGLIQLSGTSSATLAGSSANWAMAQADTTSPASLLADGITGGYIYSYQTNTSSPVSYSLTPSGSMIGSTVKQGVPYGWTLALDSGSTTAMSKGILGFGYAVEQNPFSDGNDDFVMQFQGYAGTGAPQISLTQSIQTPLANAFTTGSQQRGICRIMVSAGPNGHLYGLTGVVVKYLDINTGSFVPPGLSSGSFAIWAGLTGNGATVFNDASLWTGAPGVKSANLVNLIILDEITPPAQVQGGGANTFQMVLYITLSPNDPVSATVRFRNCRTMQVSQ